MHEILNYSWVSWLHLASALLAMVLGAVVLLRRKGDHVHKRAGYAYVIAMALVNLTAFGLYRLFGTFGPFHVAALVSGLTVFAGMFNILRRPRRPNSMVSHMVFMYWSVIGLYAAFFSEAMVRLPLPGGFAALVGAATGATVLAGALLQGRMVKRWSARYPGADPEGIAPQP